MIIPQLTSDIFFYFDPSRLEMADVKSEHHELWKAFDDTKLLGLSGTDLADLSHKVMGKSKSVVDRSKSQG